jgi:hypothetical protein
MKIVSVEIDSKKAKLLKLRGWAFDWSVSTDLITNTSILKALVIGNTVWIMIFLIWI